MSAQPEPIDDSEILSLVGGIRRIGETGPIYQVVGLGGSSIKGKATAKIELIESGETIDYPVDDLLDDRLEA